MATLARRVARFNIGLFPSLPFHSRSVAFDRDTLPSPTVATNDYATLRFGMVSGMTIMLYCGVHGGA